MNELEITETVQLTGKSLVGGEWKASGDRGYSATNPGTGEELPGRFSCATANEVDETMSAAAKAFPVYRALPIEKRAAFLEAIAEEIKNLGDDLVERTMQEAALPKGRVLGERGRTCNQLKLFAQHIREGSWVEASIDLAHPNREPLPKPDVRKMLMPVGPVVVFGASNFPLAFSTAGGDTASALAAGCPVVVKAHPSHPGCGELVAKTIQRAADKTGMPKGVFSFLHDDGYEVGKLLVEHPIATAVAFTGSLKGGRALMDLAAKRPNPIPVFAEMGSVNPVLLFPSKLKEEGSALAPGLVGAVCLGVGQFCTNPGILLALKGEELDQFKQAMIAAVEGSSAGSMLNAGIWENYVNGKTELLEQPGVELLAVGADNADISNDGRPALAGISGKDFLGNPVLREEVFGPLTLLVECENETEMKTILQSFDGQLTTSVMAAESDLEEYQDLILETQQIAGRIVFNGVPTGVEVCHSMHHGGNYPATSDGKFTSVGTDAIKRFGRPVCFQNAPEPFLPEELKNGNPNEIWRRVDGEISNRKI